MAQYQASGYQTGRGNWQYDPVKQKYFTPAYETEEDFKKNQLAKQRAEEDAALKQELEKQAEETRKRFAGYIPPDITSVEKTGPVELQDILARQKAGLEGYNTEQLAAMRAQMAQGQQAAQLQRDRALQAALAKQNIRGGAAASLQTQAALQAARERAGQDTEMMLKQAAKQEQALQRYREGVMSSLDVAQKRQFQELATKLAAEQAAAAQEAGRRGQIATERYGESMAQSQKGGCCAVAGILINATVYQGMNEARAHELILESKKPEFNLVLNTKEKNFVDQMNALRACRDAYCTEKEKRGYYILSEAIVPHLKDSKILQVTLNNLVVKPFIEMGNAHLSNKKPSFISKLLTKTWIKSFNWFATDTKFQRNNGEWV